MTSPTILNRDSVLEGLKWVFRDGKNTGSEFILAQPAHLAGGRTVDRITWAEIDSVVTKLQQAKLRTESSFQWSNVAEFSLIPLSENGAFERFLEEKEFEGQGDNPSSFIIGSASPEFAAYLLCLIVQYPDTHKTSRWVMLRHRVRAYIREGVESRRVHRLTGDTLLDVVAEFLWVTTLRIESTKETSDFEALANAFLFQAAYNADAVARIGLDPMFGPRSIQRARRTQSESFDAPRQVYESDLVHHYLMGVAAEIPLLEYLAYYHIAEHFFEKVFNDDLVKQVREGIVDPAFSARRAKDIQGIVKIVTKAQRQVREGGGVNEQRALQLVLDRFVKIPRLISDLEAYDSTLVDYYGTHDVPFAGASKVELRMADEEAVKSAAARRIYKVRNSLVHAKEGEHPRYAPFAHDGELSREIPLMRFAAEQVIIAHGKAL